MRSPSDPFHDRLIVEQLSPERRIRALQLCVAVDCGNYDEALVAVFKSSTDLDARLAEVAANYARIADPADAARFNGLAYSAANPDFGRGTLTYRDLTKQTAGRGLQAHHLIPQSLFDDVEALKAFYASTADFKSLALTPKDHDIFTKRWGRGLIDKINNAGQDRQGGLLADEIEEIYGDYPDGKQP